MITMTMKKALSGMKIWRIVMLIFMLSFIAVAPPLAQAAIPRYINYQGKLTDADDNPVTGDISITVRIYDAESGGTALWTEAQETTVTRGIFSILLGNAEVLDNLDFNNPYWYSVEVESDGEMTPRQRLTSVAYAINADKVDGYDASQFLRSDTDTELMGNLTVTGGVITSGANEDIIIDPTGTGNVVVKIDSTSGDFKITDNTTNWVLVDSETGNVSIAQDLTVSGTIYGQIAATSGNSTFSSIVVTGDSDLRGNISNSGASNGGAVNIADSLSQTGADNQVSFAGNVNAENGLDVTGALTVSGQTTLNDVLDMNSRVDLNYSGDSSALSVSQTGAGPSAQFTGGEVVVGDSAGNINAVSPGELYVQGDLEVDGTIYGDITSTGDTTMGDVTMGTLTVTGASDLRGDISDTTGVLTVADNLLVSGSAITSSGTDDYAMSISQTLNDSGAAGGSDVYRGIKLNLTETDNTGWDNVYLMDLRAGLDGTTQEFYVDNSGNTKMAGSLTIGSTVLSEIGLIDLTDGGATDLHIHTGLMPGPHASTHMTGGSDNVYWSQLDRAEGDATTVSSEIDSDISTHAALTTTHGVSGAIVGTTDTQILSSKTLTNPLISQIYGGSAANDDISIDGTSSATKATSYVLLQSGGGNVGIGTTEPTKELDVNGDIIADHIELRGGSPATITFGSGADSKQLQFDPATQEFSFTGGKLQQQFQNLVRGGDFETYRPAGWYSYWTGWYYNYTSNTCGYNITPTESNMFKFGKKSLCIWDDVADNTAFMSYYVDAWQRLRGQYITLSVWARADGNSSARASIGIATDYSTEATEVVNIDLKYDTVNNTPWRNFTQTFLVPATAQTLRIYIYAAAGTIGGVPTSSTKTTDAYSGDGITGANTVYYDGVTLTEGKLAMPFGPSPVFDAGDQRIGGSLAIGADIDPYSDYGTNYYNYPRIIFGEPDVNFGGYYDAYDGNYTTYGGGTGEMSFRRMGTSSGMFAFNRPIGVDTYDTYDYWNTWARPGLFIGSLYNYGSNTVDTPDYAWAPSDAYIKGVLEADGGIYGDIMAGGYGGVGKSSNLLEWSEDFSNPVWEKNTGTVDVSSGGQAPDGNNTAFLLTNNGGTSIEQEVLASPNTTYTFSVYLAPGSSYSATLYLKTDNPGSSWWEWPLNYKNASLSYNSSQPWRRFSITYTTQSSDVTKIRARIGDIYGSIKAWGAQLRQSSSPGIYINTASTSIDSTALFHGDGSGITNLTASNISGTAAITGISGDTFNIGSTIDATTNDINLAFGDPTAGQQTLTYAGSGSIPAADIFKFSDDLMINSAANAANTDVVLTFGGANPETLKFTGAGTKNFVFSDIVDATGFKVNGTSLAAGHLTDGAQIAHINEQESITGGWSFDTAATNFTTDVNMVYAGAENLAITSAASSAVDAVTLDIASTSADQVRGIVLTQNANSAQPVDVGLEIANLDTDTAMGTAIKITPTGAIATGLDLGGTSIANSGNITGSGALTLSSGSASDLNLTGANGVNVTATAQDIALNATTATSGGVSITGPGASIDVGGVADGLIGVNSTSVSIDKGDAGTLNLRSGTTNYLSLGADESIALGNSAAPAPLTVNASTIGISPTGNTTVNMAAGKNIAVKASDGTTSILTVDEANKRVAIYNLQVTGEETIVNTTTTDVDHLYLGVGGVSAASNAIDIQPDSGITWTGNILTAKNTYGGSNVFVIDNSGNITTAGTYLGYTIAHSTHAQNTDTGTSQNSFKIANTLDANASDVTLTFGNTNPETIIFQGSSADKDFIFSDKIVAAGLDAQSQGITNVGNISDDANINIDLAGGTDKTLAILNSGAGVTNVTVDGSLTLDRLLFDNSTLNSDTWATSGVNNITLSPGGAKVLPGAHEAYDLGDAATIGSSVFSGAGALTMSVTSSDAYVDTSRTYVVKLDTAGDIGEATFKWSRNNGATWVQELKATSANDTPLENGIAVKFGGSGGAIDDQWTIPVTANIGWKAMYTKKISTDSIYVPVIYPESSGGSITIQGDLNVTGTQTITGTTQYQGAQTITVTSPVAFLVENGSGADVFIIDTVTPQVNVLTNLDVADSIKAGTNDAFQVASNGAITTTGSIITTAGGVMTSAGLLTASAGMSLTSGNLAISADSNIVVNSDRLIIYGETGKVVTKSTLTQSSSIGMIPEYDNATPIGDGDDNFGTLCVLYQAPHNYYEWTTNEPTVQDYDIVLRYRLPEGFSAFDANVPIKIWNRVSANTADTFITVTMLDTNGVDVPLTDGSNLKNIGWTESTITMNTTGRTLAPGGYITIKIRMSADQGQKVDVGELSLKGNW